MRIAARCLWAGVLGLAALTVAGLWWLNTTSVTLGPELRDRATDRLAPMLAARDSRLDVQQLAVGLRAGLVPAIEADGITLTGPDGGSVTLDRLELLVDRSALLQGRLAPRALRIDGMAVSIIRAAEGAVTLQAGDEALLQGITTPGELVSALQGLLSQPPLADLETVGITDVSARVTDALTGSVLESGNADLRLERDAGWLDLRANLGSIGDAGAPGSALVELRAGPNAENARLRVALRGIVPARLAGLTAFGARADLLDRIDAPLSLDLAGSLTRDGALGTLSGRGSAGSGTLQFADPIGTVALSSATAQVVTRDGGQRFDLTDLEIDTDRLALSGRGSLLVTPPHPARPGHQTLTAQLDLAQVQVDAGDRLPAPLDLREVQADARITLDDAALSIEAHAGLAVNGDRLEAHVLSTGPGGARDPGRALAVDVTSARVDRDTIFDLWPIGVFPRTRQWLDNNVVSGIGENVGFSLRFPSGDAPPRIAFAFGFRDADIRYLGPLAPLAGASGLATLEGKTFRLALDEGQLEPEQGAPITVHPSVMIVPDVTRRPGLLEFELDLGGPTGSFLGILASPPFREDPDTHDLLPASEATGQTRLAGSLSVPLGDGGGIAGASFTIDGTVTDFTNDTFLAGRVLAAEEVTIAATEAHLAISADATVAGEPLTVRFERPLRGAADRALSPQITARAPLTRDLADAFGAPLPEGLLSGVGQLEARLTMDGDGPPALTLDADLAGLEVSVPAVGLAKSASADGTAEVAVTLSQPPEVTAFRLAMPGLSASGSATLAPGGGLAQARLGQLDLGNWLSARGGFEPARDGQPARLDIAAGQIDLRRRPTMPNADTGGAGAPDLSLRLDRVIVTDGLELTDLVARLPGAPGATGQLTGSVNGRAPFSADLVRRRAGLAGVLRSDDAGALLAAANLFERARGGRLDLSLVPTGARGVYDGQLQVTNAALTGPGTAARILSAVSIVGALEQMGGAGITFTEIGARFTLSPGTLRLHNAFAEGPSLGMSLDGTVDLDSAALALDGAISPVFFLNRLGGSRRGEGLIAPSFRVTGTARAPEVRLTSGARSAPETTRDPR